MADPKILIIDDIPEEQGGLALLADNIKVLHPEDLSEHDLDDVRLILVDYDLKEWPARDETSSLCQRPADGLALGAVIRSQLKAKESTAPVSFAILTGALGKLAHPLPSDNREHALAALVNFDWIFQKQTNAEDLIRQVIDLSRGVEALPEEWGSENALRQLAELLGLNFEDSENQQYLLDIEDCLPPIHELSEWSHGVAIIRWLLHRILPYPTFLINNHQLAARIRANTNSLEACLLSNLNISEALTPYRYTGILNGFSGERWWRSGIESFLWQATAGKSADYDAVREAMNGLAGGALEVSEPTDYPIVCLDENYRELTSFFCERDAVRIRPDYYPSYADQAWTPIELAKDNAKLRSIVLREDVELLTNDAV